MIYVHWISFAECHNIFALMVKGNQEVSESENKLYTFTVTDSSVEKTNYLRTLCNQIATVVCRTDAVSWPLPDHLYFSKESWEFSRNNIAVFEASQYCTFVTWFCRKAIIWNWNRSSWTSIRAMWPLAHWEKLLSMFVVICIFEISTLCKNNNLRSFATVNLLLKRERSVVPWVSIKRRISWNGLFPQWWARLPITMDWRRPLS